METEEERKARLENEIILLPPCGSEQGKVIVVGVHIYIYMFVDKQKFKSYFSNRLTFSKICGRTSRRFSYLMRTLLYLFDG